MTVRRLARDAGDGYASELVPGIHSVADAERLADELAFAEGRLRLLTAAPPGLYADLADPGDELEERLWLAVQIAILGPLDIAAEDPFAAIVGARTSWASGDSPALPAASLGPRAGDPTHASRAFAAYRAWAQRLGGQATALAGESSWTPVRRFDRTFERLGTLSLARGARFDLLASLGRTGVIPLAGERLHVGGSDPVTIAAKRVFGIGDPLLIERRAAELAGASGLPLEAFDLGLYNWERRARYGAGADPALPLDAGLLAATRAALGLE